MKKVFFTLLVFSSALLQAQDHFSGVNTSNRSGIMNATMNPAEFANLASKYEIQIFSVSANTVSNKIGFSDLISGDNVGDIIFQGSAPVNFRFDGEVYGPGFAIRHNKWVFAFSTKTNAKLNVVDVDPVLGNAITNGNPLNLTFITGVSDSENQRLNATAWGEIGLTAATSFYEDETHRLNAGATLKILFPGSYANFGASDFSGTVVNTNNDVGLTNTTANLNIAYSGSLARDFSDTGNYGRSLFGKMNGLAADLGINYQLKDDDGKFKLNAGVAIRNIGGMTFKSSNNSSTDYRLLIPASDTLSLRPFQNANNLQQVEAILINSGYLDRNQKTSTDFKVKLPTVFSAYANVKLIPELYVALYTQQKFSKDDENDQITTQNVISLTPRVVLGKYEIFLPWASNEISGISGGIGFKAGGFFIGSGSIITGLLSDAGKADAYIGYSFQLQ